MSGKTTGSNTITAEDLRAFVKCSQLRHYGGSVDLPVKTKLLEYIYIKVVLDILRGTDLELSYALGLHAQHAERELGLRSLFPADECKELIRHATIAADELFRLLRPNVYIPVFGPFNYQVKVSNSILDLQVSSLCATPTHVPELKLRTRTYHAVAFSPMQGYRNMENDIVARIQALTLANANPLKLQSTSARIRLHLIGTSASTSDLQYTYLDIKDNQDRKAWAASMENVVRAYESKYHYPLVPCPHACVFKERCQPIGE